MKNTFDCFNPSEFLLILKHLKLGRVHLRKILAEQEFQELINLVPVQQTDVKVPVKKTEFLMPFNGMLTGILGGWLGLSGYLEINTDSFSLLFIILTVAILFGIIVGRQNIKLAKSSAKGSYEDRKIEELRKHIIKKLEINRKKEIEEKTIELRRLIGNEVNLDNILKQKKEREIPTSVAKLIRSNDLSIPRPSWIQANCKSLVISFGPTLLGGFGSVFFYLPTVPRLAKGLGHKHIFETLTTPQAKSIQLMIVLCITAYLCINTIFTNRQAFKRDKELQEQDKEIAKMENELDLLDDHLLKVKEALQNNIQTGLVEFGAPKEINFSQELCSLVPINGPHGSPSA